MEEAVSHVEGCAAPAFQRKRVRLDFRGGLHALHNVPCAHAGCKQGLVRVPGGGVADQQLFLLQHPLGNGFRALGVQHLL
ncbi:hypothetical protein SDC9_159165 [bioreactor metagenome]|uniref:Uncharacterized protein n=1 Tax=bioreactor metagenome TaxID=1076179 RepID=A0A645FC55_9ZZZZ